MSKPKYSSEFKIVIAEVYLTTNLWPVMLTCCVKKKYSNIEALIGDDVFNQEFLPLKFIVDHGRDESVPENLMALGNIPDISEHCKKCIN